VFSPIARPGQTVKIRFRLERWEGQSVGVEGYVRDTFSKAEMIATRTIFPEEGKAYWLEFAIPDLLGSAADEVGLKLTSYSGKGKRDSGRLLVDRFSISGKARYAIDISRQTLEFGCVTPFSHDGGSWSLEAGRLHLMTPVRAASYTGGYKVGDQRISAKVRLWPEGATCLSCARGARCELPWRLRPGWCIDFKIFRHFPLARADFHGLPDSNIDYASRLFGVRITLYFNGLRVLEGRRDAFATAWLAVAPWRSQGFCMALSKSRSCDGGRSFHRRRGGEIGLSCYLCAGQCADSCRRAIESRGAVRQGNNATALKVAADSALLRLASGRR